MLWGCLNAKVLDNFTKLMGQSLDHVDPLPTRVSSLTIKGDQILCNMFILSLFIKMKLAY